MLDTIAESIVASTLLTWGKRLMGICWPAMRFCSMERQIERLLNRMCDENENVRSLSETRMSPRTVSDAKKLTRKFEKLGIMTPEIRRIDRWIDWLAYMQILSGEMDLKSAQKADPYTPTLSYFSNIDERGPPPGFRR